VSKPKIVTIGTEGLVVTALLVDHKELSNEVISYQIIHQTGQLPKLILEYACYEQLTIAGEMEIIHVCPKIARKT